MGHSMDRGEVYYLAGVQLILDHLTKKVLPNWNVQWNVFKGVYFYWEKSTPQFKIELISGEYFFPCESKFFPGKYYSGSTFFPGNYYSGSNFFRGVIIYGYTGQNQTPEVFYKKTCS